MSCSSVVELISNYLLQYVYPLRWTPSSDRGLKNTELPRYLEQSSFSVV